MDFFNGLLCQTFRHRPMPQEMLRQPGGFLSMTVCDHAAGRQECLPHLQNGFDSMTVGVAPVETARCQKIIAQRRKYKKCDERGCGV